MDQASLQCTNATLPIDSNNGPRRRFGAFVDRPSSAMRAGFRTGIHVGFYKHLITGGFLVPPATIPLDQFCGAGILPSGTADRSPAFGKRNLRIETSNPCDGDQKHGHGAYAGSNSQDDVVHSGITDTKIQRGQKDSCHKRTVATTGDLAGKCKRNGRLRQNHYHSLLSAAGLRSQQKISLHRFNRWHRGQKKVLR